uniref:Solute carrier family 22 member 13 n=1 Tax=Junco hyemalis TaxID=40217 RepID=A0A8C5IHP0_JUNHY
MAFLKILKAVGDFGRFQKCLVLLSVIPCLSVAFHQFCQLFMVVEVPHHCDTSWILAVGPNLTEEEQLNLTLPRGPDGHFEQCSMFSPVDWDLDSILAYGLNHTEKCSSGWVYPSDISFSFLQFDLVCDRKDLNDIAQAIYMAGLLLGSMIFGPLSDRIGRRPVVLISVFLQGLFGLGIAFVPHFYVYMAFRCVVGASVSGITMTLLALVLTSHCCFAIGQMILAGLSYGIRNWRLLEIAGSALIFAFFFCMGWTWASFSCSDSLSFCVLKLKPVVFLCFYISWEMLGPNNWTSMLHFLMAATCSVPPCLAFRFVNSFVYYGLSLNVTNFGLDIYLTQLAFGAVEIPARFACIFTLQRFGRRKTQAVLLVLSGLVCLIITGIPEDQPVATTVLATIGKFAASASFSTSYVYAAELFPTVVRQTGVGLCSVSARVAGILAPLVRLLGQHHRAIPMAVFGSAPVLGGLLCILLPETCGTDLADDTGDGHPPAQVGAGGRKQTAQLCGRENKMAPAFLSQGKKKSSCSSLGKTDGNLWNLWCWALPHSK